MRPPTRTLRDRWLSVLTVCLCALAIGIVATTLEASLSSDVAPKPPESSSASGVSLLALLYVLLDALLSPLGISLEPPAGATPGGSVVEALVASIRALYRHRVQLLAGLVLLAVLGLAYQYRRRLPSPLDSRTTGDQPVDSSGDDRRDWPPGDPPDAVQRAWVRMVRAVDGDVDDPSSRTVSEWRALAIDDGLDPGAVGTITDAFRAVRYGTATVTSERREHVRDALEQIGEGRRRRDERRRQIDERHRDEGRRRSDGQPQRRDEGRRSDERPQRRDERERVE